jgi:hypothetical protein
VYGSGSYFSSSFGSGSGFQKVPDPTLNIYSSSTTTGDFKENLVEFKNSILKEYLNLVSYNGQNDEITPVYVFFINVTIQFLIRIWQKVSDPYEYGSTTLVLTV